MQSTYLFLVSLTLITTAGAAPIPESSPNPQITAAVKEISAKNIEASIRKLVSFGTRHTLSDTTSETRGIGAARA